MSKINILYSKCNNCPINVNCEKFKDKYNKVVKNVDSIIKKNKQISKNNFEHTPHLWKQQHKDFDFFREHHITQNIKKLSDSCVVEKSLLETSYKELDKKYDLKKNTELIIFVEQILLLKQYGFKLSLAHNKHGIMREITKNFKTNEKIPVLVPGIQYAIEIPEKIAIIMERMDKIAFGEKHIIEEVTTIKYEDVFKTDINNNKIIEVNEIK